MSTFLSCFTSSVQEQIDTESPRREQEQTPDKEQQQQQDTKQQNQNIQVSKELPDPRSIIQLLYANAKAGGSLPDNEDKRLFNQQGAKLTFGEIADVQLNQLLSKQYLNAGNPDNKTFFDLGMGLGKLALETFLRHSNLTYVLGVELSTQRFAVAKQALYDLCEHYPRHYHVISADEKTESYVLEERSTRRVLEIRHTNCLHLQDREYQHVDVLNLNVDLSNCDAKELTHLLKTVKDGVRVAAYNAFGKSKAVRDELYSQRLGSVSYLSIREKGPIK